MKGYTIYGKRKRRPSKRKSPAWANQPGKDWQNGAKDNGGNLLFPPHNGKWEKPLSPLSASLHFREMRIALAEAANRQRARAWETYVEPFAREAARESLANQAALGREVKL